jgi:hypothetical protein
MKGVLDGRYATDLDETPRDRLIEKSVYFVEACQFTFEFLSLRQLEIALAHFEEQHRGSTRIVGGIGAADHWEVQRWFERLPKRLERKHRRAEVAAALRDALGFFRAT